MKRGLATAMLVATLVLGGCGKETTGGNAAAAAGGEADPYEAKIAALQPAQRNIVFYKAIYDADYQCGKVVTVTDRARDNGHKAWTVTCNDTGDFYMTLNPGGILTVSGTPSPKKRFPAGTKMLSKETK